MKKIIYQLINDDGNCGLVSSTATEDEINKCVKNYQNQFGEPGVNELTIYLNQQGFESERVYTIEVNV